jgi:hypothetical protein
MNGMVAPSRLQRRLRRSAGLVSVGLAIEVVTLQWAHPTAFLAFLGLGCTLVGTGALLYLWTLVADREQP